MNYHIDDLMEPDVFNERMVDYLVWYNAKRPHWALGLKSPLEFLILNQQLECNMWWPNTFDLNMLMKSVKSTINISYYQMET